MKKRILAVILAAMLLLAGAALAQADDPASYMGHWVGGPSYGEAHEYTLDITGYAYGHYSANLELYRIWAFEDMEAELLPNPSVAVLMTNNADDFLVEGRLYFSDGSIDLEVIQSTFEYLPAGTFIHFER